jgi:hypothetical protein
MPNAFVPANEIAVENCCVQTQAAPLDDGVIIRPTRAASEPNGSEAQGKSNDHVGHEITNASGSPLHQTTTGTIVKRDYFRGSPVLCCQFAGGQR